jgi:hypothetical protein
MTLTIHPGYFMDVVSWIYIIQSDRVILDLHDSYVKQTYRNRCYIAAANGKLSLNIPIIHQGGSASPAYRSIIIDNDQHWAQNHFKSLRSAYKSSPFFEFYEDEIRALYVNVPASLMEWNIKLMNWIARKLYISFDPSEALDYQKDQLATYLITVKKDHTTSLEPYIQVFQEKHGFLPHLCILDVLFNLGPATRAYLLHQTVDT